MYSLFLRTRADLFGRCLFLWCCLGRQCLPLLYGYGCMGITFPRCLEDASQTSRRDGPEAYFIHAICFRSVGCGILNRPPLVPCPVFEMPGCRWSDTYL